jgi:hypothetical protein
VDFVIEFVIQFIVQVLIDVLWDALLEGMLRGLAELLFRRVGRFVLSALFGFGCGWFWGHHLTGGSSWPKLLWVSLVLSGTALALAAGRAGATSERLPAGGRQFPWTALLAPPWRWSAERLLAFTTINAAIATGIAVSFRPAVLS